ncbi:tyrosine recombinase XerC [Sphingomonas sp.]|uniref:site-specific integrase n=1 Tax=Sphingomonas sp. TaxID=28214 RepID=UPI0037521C73
MAKHSEKNARIKRDYFRYRREAQRSDEKSIDVVARALTRFEESTRHKDFATFNREQAVAFKRRLGEDVSKATAHTTLSALKSFFHWLAGQPGFRSKLTYADANYFNLSDKEVRIARASLPKAFPSLEQVNHVLATMPAITAIEKRDRALIACAILTGARDGALRSLRLKHVNIAEQRIDQDAREVDTKNSKTFSTWFFPVGGDALAILTDWCTFLRSELHRGDGDALFPATAVAPDRDSLFAPAGLRAEGWRSTGPVRLAYQRAFSSAGLPYFKPHSLRDTLAQLGERICPTVEAFKAWSQNLGHSGVLTTLTSYGTVAPHRQAELIRSLGTAKPATPDGQELARAIATIQRLAPKSAELPAD